MIRDHAIGSFRLPLLQLLQRAAVASLSLAWGLASADPAQAGCRFKLEAESGRQVAVAAAQPLYQNGQIQFRISRGTSGAELQVCSYRLNSSQFEEGVPVQSWPGCSTYPAQFLRRSEKG